MFLVTLPIVINACYCLVAGKFEHQKKYDVNVCKQETSLFLLFANKKIVLVKKIPNQQEIWTT